MGSIKGNLVSLRKVKISEYPLFHKWFSNKEVVRYSLGKWQKKHSPIQIKKWLTETLRDRSVQNFGIVENSTNNLIGYAGICRLDKTNSEEYFIFIGDKNSWGKGYGTEVTKMVVDFGFKKLKLNKLTLTVSEPNIAGVRVYIKTGFKQADVLKDASLRDGKYHNKIVMSILNSEWKK